MAHSEAERQAMAMPREGDRPLEDASASARAQADALFSGEGTGETEENA